VPLELRRVDRTTGKSTLPEPSRNVPGRTDRTAELVNPSATSDARRIVLEQRALGTADSAAGLGALIALVQSPSAIFAVEGYLQTGVIERDPAAARARWRPAIEALPDDARRAYDAVIRRRGGAGLDAVLAAASGDGRTPEGLMLPDLERKVEFKAGKVSGAFSVKLDAKDSAIITQEWLAGLKLTVADVKASRAGLKSTTDSISMALLGAKYSAGHLPAPLDKITPSIEVKLFEQKLSAGLAEWTTIKIKIGFAADLSDRLPPALQRTFKLVAEGSGEYKIDPSDLVELRKLYQVYEEAAVKAADLVKLEQEVKDAQRVASALAEEKTALSKLIGAGARQLGTRMSALEGRLAEAGVTAAKLQSRLYRAGKAFELVEDAYRLGLGKLSPVFRALEPILVKVLGSTLAKVLGKALPIVNILMTIWDLYKIATWIRDMAYGRSGFEWNGGEEPDPFKYSWLDTRRGTNEPIETLQSPEQRDARIAKLSGPRRRLLDAVTAQGGGVALPQTQLDRLLAVIEASELADTDVDKLLTDVRRATSADQAIDAIAAGIAAITAPITTPATAPRTGSTDRPVTKPKRRPPTAVGAGATVRIVPDANGKLDGVVEKGEVHFSVTKVQRDGRTVITGVRATVTTSWGATFGVAGSWFAQGTKITFRPARRVVEVQSKIGGTWTKTGEVQFEPVYILDGR